MNIKNSTNTQTLALVLSLMTLVGGAFKGANYITDTVATKSDILSIKNDIGLLRIEASIALIQLHLANFDEKENLSLSDKREIEILESQLKEYQMRLLGQIND
jgi:hypothetical protein